MECVPPLKAAVVIAAIPPLRLTVPRVTVPSWKVAVPVGVAAVDDTTCTVRVTGCPKVEGLREDATLVEVPACTPVPDNGTVVVPAGVLSGIVRLALALPATVGLKSTKTRQEAPTRINWPLQPSSVSWKSASPAMLTLNICSEALPLLVKITSCEPLLEKTA